MSTELSASHPETDLANTIAQLQAALDQAQQQESRLQETIAQLQSVVEQQANQITDLQEQLQQVQQVRSALSQAEQAAFKLAEMNHQLLEENTKLREQQAPAPLAVVSQPEVRLPGRPVFPDTPLPSGMSNQDLGWVD